MGKSVFEHIERKPDGSLYVVFIARNGVKYTVTAETDCSLSEVPSVLAEGGSELVDIACRNLPDLMTE